MEKISPLEFLDYREYLLAFFEYRKANAPWYSYKVFGDGVGLDQSQVFRILQKNLHISKRALPRFVEYLKLNEKEAIYFEKLVELGRARSESETRRLFAEVLALKGAQSKELKNDQYELYSKWYHSVVRTLLGFVRIQNDYAALGAMVSPPISADEAKNSVELLQRLGLIERDAEGFWKLSDKTLTTGGDYSSKLIRAYQAESMKLAMQSLDIHEKSKRDINVMNMALDESAFKDCLAILNNARDEIRARVEKVNSPDRVMRFATAFFPVAFSKEVSSS